MSPAPLGWVLRCTDSKAGTTWLDFADGAEAPRGEGWTPVWGSPDGLLADVATLAWNGHLHVWNARLRGSSVWGTGTTVEEAVRGASEEQLW